MRGRVAGCWQSELKRRAAPWGASVPPAVFFVAVRSRHMARGEATKLPPCRFRTAIRESCFSASPVVSRPPLRRLLRALICRGLPLRFPRLDGSLVGRRPLMRSPFGDRRFLSPAHWESGIWPRVRCPCPQIVFVSCRKPTFHQRGDCPASSRPSNRFRAQLSAFN